VSASLLVFVSIVIGGAGSALSRLPDLQPWHRLVSRLEPRASEFTERFTFDEYLRREEAVFREARDVVDSVVTRTANPAIPNRYVTGNRSHPMAFGDFNRTQVLDTPAPKGGVLLIHGLTDSPYSMRAIAAQLHDRGFYTLSLRMQGHGTVPGGLVNTDWEDWMAAVTLGARQVRTRIGPDRPLVLVGYSNGGALVTKYALDALENPSLPAPSRLILISPMIGVSPTAWLARAISRLGPVVEKARWLDIYPEYNPFKYNSFPANAGFQSARLTRALSEQLSRLSAAGRLQTLAPVLAFQSVVDSTVSTPAVIYDLFDRLPAGGHELVLFDLNRQARTDAFTRPGAVLPRLLDGGTRRFAVTLVTNTSADTLDASAMSVAGAATTMTAEPIGLAWPADMFSLSHVALPFPGNDPLYGSQGPLGSLKPRGEKDVLIVSLDALMRVSWNPFYPYLASRIDRATTF
jgi:alpha-beta hydrolase superfamily lysophospholipase